MNTKRNLLKLMLILGLAIGLAMVTGRQAFGGSSTNGRTTDTASFPLIMASGVTPRMSVGEVTNLVLSELGPNAKIVRVTLVGDDRDVELVEPGAGRPGPDAPASGPIWIVRATGNFVGRYVPPGRAPIVSPTGYILVHDQSGIRLGMGLP